MLTVKDVDYEEVKDACIALNEVLDKPFQMVGTAKDVLVSQFVETIEELSDDDKNGLPDSVIEFYNVLFADEAVGDAEPEQVEESTQTEGKEESEPEKETEPEIQEKEEPETEAPTKDKKKDKEKEKDNLAKARENSPVGTRAYNNFSELVKVIKKNNTPTGFVDKKLLNGGKLTKIVEALKEHVTGLGALGYKGFRSVNAIKAHIVYREDRGWIYEHEGADEEETAKLVGFEDPKVE